jgi:hypothetical protein
MTVKMRLEALHADMTVALTCLKSAGAKLTGITRLYANRNHDEARLYAVR